MFIGIIIAIALGVLLGTFTGICPGIHINLVSVMIVGAFGSSAFLAGINPIYIAAAIVAMGITHTILDSLPSTFLGCPDESMIMSALPAHKMLLQGRGKEAIKLMAFGSLAGLIVAAVLILASINIVKPIYEIIQPFIGFALLAIVCFMILKEKTAEKRFKNLFLFIASGILGLCVLNFPNLEQPLLPMLSGMFGISSLLLSLAEKVSIPAQIDEDTKDGEDDGINHKTDRKLTLKCVIASSFSGSIVGLLPGLGSAQAAVLASTFIGEIGDAGYLILTGGIGTVNFLFSTATFYTLEKARNGAVVAVMEIIDKIDFGQLLIIMAAAIVAGACATVIVIKLAKRFSEWMIRIDYQKTCIAVMALISLIVLIFSGLSGILIMMVSAALGLIAPLMQIPRSSAMGCLLLPVILYFLV